MEISEELTRRVNEFEENEWDNYMRFYHAGLHNASEFYRIRHSAIIDLMRELGIENT